MALGREKDLIGGLKFLEKYLLIFAVLVALAGGVFSELEEFTNRLLLASIFLLSILSGSVTSIVKVSKTLSSRIEIVIAIVFAVLCLFILHAQNTLQPHEYLLAAVIFSSVFSIPLLIGRDLIRLSLAVMVLGYSYTNLSTEVISHSNKRPELVLEKGDTVSMGPYFASYHKNKDDIYVTYYKVQPRHYLKGQIVKFEDMVFRSVKAHVSSIEFVIDLNKEYWELLSFANEDMLEGTEVWANGEVGEKAFEFINMNRASCTKRTFAFDIQNEILAESADGNTIIIRATKMPLTIVILLGGLLLLIGISIRWIKPQLKSINE